jgi:uncharacterized protein YicC (UPF0701 family)
MIKSMTAYGRASRSTPQGQWVLEIHSVNRKMLDINTNIPKELLSYDIEIRKLISERIQRGLVTIRLALHKEEGTIFGIPSLEQFRKFKAEWERLAIQLGYDPKQAITLSFLSSQWQLSGTPWLHGVPNLQELIRALVEDAMKELIIMKEKEGSILAQDIKERLQLIEHDLKKISQKSPHAVTYYREKLKSRIQEVCENQSESDERILREVALFAEKVDITEELIRLDSHLFQFRMFLNAKEEKSIGRTLDFLTQEMNREINTLGAKSADSEISHLTVKIKSEIEKIREQIQNIE